MTFDFKSRRVATFLIFSIILADQLSKYLIQKLGLIGGCNGGAAFGIGHLNPIVPIFVIALVFALFAREKDYQLKLGLALILAGGFSNVIDRIFTGCVRDFISVLTFPMFNLADCAITLGALIFAFRFALKR